MTWEIHHIFRGFSSDVFGKLRPSVWTQISFEVRYVGIALYNVFKMTGSIKTVPGIATRTTRCEKFHDIAHTWMQD